MVHKISSYGRSNWENGSKGDKKGQFYGLITNIFSYHVSARALKSFQTILMGVGGVFTLNIPKWFLAIVISYLIGVLMIKNKDKASKCSGDRMQVNQKVYNLPFSRKWQKALKMSHNWTPSNRDFEKSTKATKMLFGTLLN